MRKELFETDENGLQTHPDMILSLFHLAVAYGNLADTENKIKYLEEALKIWNRAYKDKNIYIHLDKIELDKDGTIKINTIKVSGYKKQRMRFSIDFISI